LGSWRFSSRDWLPLWVRSSVKCVLGRDGLEGDGEPDVVAGESLEDVDDALDGLELVVLVRGESELELGGHEVAPMSVD
jgi:hypothetical protein